MTRWTWLLLGCLGCQTGMADVPIDPLDLPLDPLELAIRESAQPVCSNPIHRVGTGKHRPDESGHYKPEAPCLDSEEPVIEPHSKFAADEAELQITLAAALLEQGQIAEATVHLADYVAKQPDHLIARAQLGELLFKQEKHDESRREFEVFVAKAQEYGNEAVRYLIHSHTRLVEIAEAEEDAYQEHLHRGIGLYLLAGRLAAEPEPNSEYTPEALLCRAATELQEARTERPEEARPSFYLYEIWTILGQRTAARKALAAADSLALIAELTPAERRQLQTAHLREAITRDGP